VSAARNYADWLAAFEEYASIGEAPREILWWVGASTIAGALRRKVWLDQVFFQWVPNLYVVVVAEPGIVAKSTTANIGFDLLSEVDGIHFGPDITSWQALIMEMGEKCGEFFDFNGKQIPQHPITCAVDEFGTFLDPTNREQVDSLIRLYDGKQSKRAFRKITKTQTSEEMHGPWVNIFACTTPTWINSNFPEYFLGSGFLSRNIFLHATEKRQYVPLLSEQVRKFPGHAVAAAKLVGDLRQIADLVGPFHLTPAAVKWESERYITHWKRFKVGSRELQGYPARKQTHLMKLAMIVSAARGHHPVLDVQHLVEADRRLTAAEPGIDRVLARVGASEIPKAAGEIVDILRAGGGVMLRREVFGHTFYRRMSNRDFDEATRGAVAAGHVVVEPSPAGTVYKLRTNEGGSNHQGNPHGAGGGEGVREDDGKRPQ
jgi:hypothetical protein